MQNVNVWLNEQMSLKNFVFKAMVEKEKITTSQNFYVYGKCTIYNTQNKTLII